MEIRGLPADSKQRATRCRLDQKRHFLPVGANFSKRQDYAGMTIRARARKCEKLLGFGSSVRRVRIDLVGLFARSLQTVFEGANSFAKPLSELGQLLGAEDKERDRKNNEQM
jgi:hypothetical protein